MDTHHFYRATMDKDTFFQPFDDTKFNSLKKDNFVLSRQFANDDYTRMQLIKFPLYSLNIWDINPPNLNELQQKLFNSSSQFKFILTMTLTRLGPNTNKVVSYTNTYPQNDWLSASNILALASAVINGTTYSIQNQTFFPRILRLPPIEKPEPITNLYVDLALTRFTNSAGVMWWSLIQGNQTYEKDVFKSTNQTEFIVMSPEILGSNFFGDLGNIGIIGLYTGFVLAVGRFLRLTVVGLYTRVIYEDFPDCDLLLQLCMDIYTARQDRELVLEEELYHELIQLYRSPETLMDVTKKKDKID